VTRENDYKEKKSMSRIKGILSRSFLALAETYRPVKKYLLHYWQKRDCSGLKCAKGSAGKYAEKEGLRVIRPKRRVLF